MTIKYHNEAELKPGERIDDLERNGYGIIQNSGAFCFGMDAVLLSGFAAVRKGETAVDLGTGTGIIPILLSAKTEGKLFYGLEIQEAMADMAARSVRLNGLEERVKILRGDIRSIVGTEADDGNAAGNAGGAEPGAGSAAGSERQFRQDPPAALYGLLDPDLIAELAGHVDVVTSNPPYMKDLHGLKNPDDSKAIARHEVMCNLQDVCRAAARLLRSGGRFYMVHRPQRLPEIITELKKVRLEPKRIKPVYPFADKEANMVLIEAVRNAGAECRMEKPLIVYQAEGVYTDEIYDIYGY